MQCSTSIPPRNFRKPSGENLFLGYIKLQQWAKLG